MVSVSLDVNGSDVIVVAGKESSESSSDELQYPHGIFLNTYLDLYVADWGKNRIRLFPFGLKNGTTVAGENLPSNLILNKPTYVVLDRNNYLFIVEMGQNRIIPAGLTDYQCIAGCDGSSGSTSQRLNAPEWIRFDNYGNFYVTDTRNSRVQKFTIMENACSKFTRRKKNNFHIVSITFS